MIWTTFKYVKFHLKPFTVCWNISKISLGVTFLGPLQPVVRICCLSYRHVQVLYMSVRKATNAWRNASIFDRSLKISRSEWESDRYIWTDWTGEWVSDCSIDDISGLLYHLFILLLWLTVENDVSQHHTLFLVTKPNLLFTLASSYTANLATQFYPV